MPEPAFEADAWMEALARLLGETFGKRLLFLGLQGSRRRGEAAPDSDIDVVAVLDEVGMEDLARYRAALAGLPEADRACGFLAGAAELRGWPRHELFAFVQDTKPFLGTLEDLTPETDRADVAEGARVGAANLYHAAVHTCLYAPRADWGAALEEAHKAAVFVLRQVEYLRSGRWPLKRADLLPRLSGAERELLLCAMDPARYAGGEDAAWQRLLQWASGVLRGEL